MMPVVNRNVKHGYIMVANCHPECISKISFFFVCFTKIYHLKWSFNTCSTCVLHNVCLLSVKKMWIYWQPGHIFKQKCAIFVSNPKHAEALQERQLWKSVGGGRVKSTQFRIHVLNLHDCETWPNEQINSLARWWVTAELTWLWEREKERSQIFHKVVNFLMRKKPIPA